LHGTLTFSSKERNVTVPFNVSSDHIKVLKKMLSKFKKSDTLRIMIDNIDFDVEFKFLREYVVCVSCNKKYIRTDISSICKDCYKKIVEAVKNNGQIHYK